VGAETRLRLTLATSDYDHVRELASGEVRVDGVELVCLTLPVEEIFFRFARHREWQVSEFSLGKYCTLRARDADGGAGPGPGSLTAIPVFTSRCFRHSAIFVRPGGSVPRDHPAALRGARVGIPEWTVTATVYARALLQHEYGVHFSEIDWVQGGVNQPGRVEGLADFKLPPGVRLERVADRALGEMLLSDELDAIIAPHPPAAAEDGSGRIVRLFTDARRVEEDYWRRTGIFPIMHLIALRGDLHAEHPWVAMNLLRAFEEAKRRSLARALDDNASRSPIPWAATHAQQTTALFGPDPWPYGLEPNRTTLTAFLRYAHEQGLCPRELAPEELFPPEVLTAYRI
jgi:4,5-dihydroxyphthalate decarboxylase